MNFKNNTNNTNNITFENKKDGLFSNFLPSFPYNNLQKDVLLNPYDAPYKDERYLMPKLTVIPPNAVPINRAYMPTSAVEYIIVGVKGSKATFNSDVKIINQDINDKIIEAVVVAEKTSSIVNSLVRKSLLENSFENDRFLK